MKSALAFALLAGLVFYFSKNSFRTGDVVGAQLTPISLLTRGDIYLDAFVPHYQKLGKGTFPYFFHATSRGVISSYPIAIPILAIPIYAIPVWTHLNNSPADSIAAGERLGKLSAAIFAALAVFVFWRTARALGASPQLCFWLSAAFAFGSEMLTTGAQSLWMHGPGSLFLLLATYSSLCFGKNTMRY